VHQVNHHGRRARPRARKRRRLHGGRGSEEAQDLAGAPSSVWSRCRACRADLVDCRCGRGPSHRHHAGFHRRRLVAPRWGGRRVR